MFSPHKLWSNKIVWAAEMEQIFQKENVALAIAKTELRSLLNSGDTVHKAFGTYPTVQTYTKGTAITIPDYSGTDETLVVNTAQVAPMYIDHIDKIQNKWDQAEVFARRSARALNNKIDQAIFAEYTNASSVITSADMGGSGSGSFLINLGNIPNLFTVANRKLNALDVGGSKRFAVIGPQLQEKLNLYVAGRETGFGDTVGANGFVGTRFGMDIYYSNNLPFTATWTPADNPADGDSVTITGVTFTFETGSIDTAGMVNVGGDTGGSVENLTYAINGTGTEGTDYKEVEKKDRWKLLKAGVVATDNSSNLGLVAYGDIVVAASESADPWSAQIQYPLFGIKGAINMVIQEAPNVEFRMVDNKLGRNVFVWQLYGKKTFTEDKDGLVYAKIDTSAFA